MKKIFLVLGMITCMLAMSACGNAVEESTFLLTESEATEWGAGLVGSLDEIVASGTQADYASDAVAAAALESWSTALVDMGDYQGVVASSATMSDDGATILIEIEGTKRNADVTIIIDADYALSSVSVNPIYSFGEQMQKAGLNTLMGMGTVFTVLILISIVIAGFGYIPKVLETFSKKEVKETSAAPVASAPVVEAVEEDLADDLELVAVIAAAIAASEGAASAEGYQVRSIRRAKRA
ncbi:MAG: OadG family protein [Eubacteriales bacterium]